MNKILMQNNDMGNMLLNSDMQKITILGPGVLNFG